MLFNSFAYLLLFLPVTFVVYFVMNRMKLLLAAKVWLVLASLFFYGYWNPIYLPLLFGSILFNFVIGTSLSRPWKSSPAIRTKKLLLVVGVAGDLALLGYYKYTDFFIINLNHLAGAHLTLPHIILPLGISFFTFTQIAYLVDSYQGKVKEYSFMNYSLFVTFFPHLLAGPIIHHKEMMPQFDRKRNKVLNYRNIAQGLFLFFVGLFKKVIVADTFAKWANSGFSSAAALNFFEAWTTSLSYTMQIYFDFSGYTDMALGASLIFNIRLPINFNSPYKALDIRDFWRRWHMTLSRFLRDYLYIPLGGNRVSETRTLTNVVITFLLGGIWHGAGWTFAFWGFLHGAAFVAQRFWGKLGIVLPRFLAWLITFHFINVTWIFFRARTFDDAISVLKGMLGYNGVMLPKQLGETFAFLQDYGVTFGKWLSMVARGETILIVIGVALFVCVLFKNSNEMVDEFKPDWKAALFTCAIAAYTLSSMDKVSEFIYFNF